MVAATKRFISVCAFSLHWLSLEDPSFHFVPRPTKKVEPDISHGRAKSSSTVTFGEQRRRQPQAYRKPFARDHQELEGKFCRSGGKSVAGGVPSSRPERGALSMYQSGMVPLRPVGVIGR
jgi:hypothetical protein